MKSLICIGCPNGCRLTVDPENNFKVTGNKCPIGAEYGKNELQHPVRTVTSTVRLSGAEARRLPVKTDKPVDKARMFELMKLLDTVEAKAPVKRGDILLAAVLEGQANVIACRDAE